MRKYIAEFVGTLLLVFFGAGTATFGIETMGKLGVALAFGFILLALVYAIGPISGCHVNPAVTLGMLIGRRIGLADAIAYVIAQVAGGIVAAALLKLLTTWGKVKDETGGLGTNSYGEHISMGGAFVLEIILTFLLVFVVLMVTGEAAAPGFAGLAIGISLAVIHLAGIPLDGTSVNPARSLGPAIFAGGTALSQVWLFIVAPLVGGAVAAVVWPLVRSTEDAPPAITPETAESA
ncbi:MAG TPA: MIP family channel protein [Streptosporangiaceae bacterium]